MELTGVSQVRGAFRRLQAAAEGPEVDAALLAYGQALIERAAAEAPRDTGELAASAYAELTAPGIVTVGFRAPHAAAVHERLDVPHASGGAKFLERPLVETQGEVREALVGVLKEAIRG